MAQLLSAPWPKRRLSSAEIGHIVEQMRDLPCWDVRRYLGSMLLFDFGEKVMIPTLRGGSVEAGAATLSVRDCYWELRHRMAVIEDSDSVTDVSAKELTNLWKGAELIGIDNDVDSRRIEFVFSESRVLSVDVTNRYRTKDPIIEITTADGRIYEVSPKGRVYIADRVSAARFRSF